MIEEPTALTVNRARRRPSAAQIAGFQGVPTGFIVDALMGAGAMEVQICPVGDGRDFPCVAAGPALTVGNAPGDILGTLASLEFLQPGDIVVSASGGYQGCASGGDRVLGMMKNAGAAGFVSDGPLRDYTGIVEVALPAWCTGLTPASPFSTGPARVGLPIDIAGQRVSSGDMIVADLDGVVVVPFDQIDTVLARLPQITALEAELDAKVAGGQRTSPKLGDLLTSARTAWVGDDPS